MQVVVAALPQPRRMPHLYQFILLSGSETSPRAGVAFIEREPFQLAKRPPQPRSRRRRRSVLLLLPAPRLVECAQSGHVSAVRELEKLDN